MLNEPTILIASIAMTAVIFGAFPFIFARVRKETITKKKYRLICYGINAIVMVVLLVMSGEFSSADAVPSVAPYLIWTSIFSASGVKTLKKRDLLLEEPKASDGA